MKIVSASYQIFTINMPDVLSNNNRNRLISKLNNYLTDIRVSNAPASAPANMPRMVATTKDKMFSVLISNQHVQLELSNAQAVNDPVIFSTMMEHVDHLGSIFEDYSDAPFNYCGLTLQVRYDRDEFDSNPTDFINSKITGWNSDLMVDNAFVRKCFIQGQYFINLGIQNNKQVNVLPSKQSAKPAKIEITGENVLVDININDKFGFLYSPEYFCQIEQALILCEDVQAFYNDKLTDFVIKGEFDYFK